MRAQNRMQKLLEKWFDDALNSREKADLERYFRRNPRQHKQWLQEKALHNTLKNNATTMPVPERLKSRVLQAIDPYQYSRTAQKHTNSMRNFFVSPQWAYAYVFLAGLIAGFAVLYFSQKQSFDNELLSGSMLKNSTCYPLVYHSSEATVDAEVCYSNEVVSIRLEVNSEDAVVSRLEFNPAAFSVYAVKILIGNENSAAQTGYTQVSLESKGPLSAVVFLKMKDHLSQEILFTVANDQVVLYADPIEIQ